MFRANVILFTHVAPGGFVLINMFISILVGRDSYRHTHLYAGGQYLTKQSDRSLQGLLTPHTPNSKEFRI